VILVSHGTPGGHDQMNVLHRPFVERGFRILVPSRPGYLRSGIELGMSMEEQADVFASLLDSLNMDKVIVFAIAGGGPSALEFAVRHQHRCIGLIFYACIVKPITLQQPYEASSFSQSPFHQFPSSCILNRWPRCLAHELNEPLLADTIGKDRIACEIFQSMYSCQLIDYQRRVDGTVNDICQFASISPPTNLSITSPTLIIHGTADQHCPIEHSRVLKEHIPHAVMMEVKDATHYAICTHHQIIMEQIIPFIVSISEQFQQTHTQAAEMC